MGIAVKRHAVGVQGQEFLHRIRYAGAGLERQAIEDIGIQAGDPAVADHVGDLLGQLIALLAPDGFLNFGVEILHPDRGAGHARCGQGVEPGGVDLVRVNLNRKLGPFGHGDGIEHSIGQCAHRVGGQKRGRATAPVQAA